MFKAILMLISLLAVMSFAKAQAYWPFPGQSYRAFSHACEDYGKEHISHWDIDTPEELRVLMEGCRGNGDASCIRAITAPLSRWDFDTLSEYTGLAMSCRGSNTECVRWIKSKLSKLDFDDPNEVAEVASACFATDMRCVQILCQADRWSCDDKNEYLTIARSCASPLKK